MSRSKFGYDEVIHPFDTTKVYSEKNVFSFGVPNGSITKQSESIRIEDDKEAIAYFIGAIQKLKSQEQRYLCFEVFTDEKEHQIFRINICHMHD